MYSCRTDGENGLLVDPGKKMKENRGEKNL